MKDISLASGRLIQALSEAPLKANSPREQTSDHTLFTLPELALDDIDQHMLATKRVARKAAKDGDSEQYVQMQMQMLLSLFLNQGAPAEPLARVQFSSPNESGKLLQALSQSQSLLATLHPKQSGSLAGVFSNMVDDVKEQTSNLTKGDSAIKLSHMFQSMLASLMSSTPAQDYGTPAQQARLVQSTAQNLRALAPQANTSVRVAEAAPRERENSNVPLVVETRKPGAQTDTLNTDFVKRVAQTDNAPVVLATTIKAEARSEELGKQLINLLKDRIQFQLNEQQQTSTIRLDPPSLGKMNISVQVDAGKLVVYIDVSHADVSRTLSLLSDSLRQHLTQLNFMQVDVQVSTDGGSQQHSQQGNHRRSPQQQIVSAAKLESEENYVKQDESVLLKV